MQRESPVLDSDTDYSLLFLAVIATSNTVVISISGKKSGAEESSNFIKTGFWSFLLFIKFVLDVLRS